MKPHDSNHNDTQNSTPADKEIIELHSEDIEVLRLLGESCVTIRHLAGPAFRTLTDKQKLDLISNIADASHNLPNVLSKGGHQSCLNFLMADATHLRTQLLKLRDLNQ